MTLYLSQKDLVLLLLWAFALGSLAAIVYGIWGFLLCRKPRHRVLLVLWHISLQMRDFLLFVCLGIADAILTFVYNSGRVRISVFVMNLLGFLLCRLLLTRQVSKILRRMTKKLRRKSLDERNGEVL